MTLSTETYHWASQATFLCAVVVFLYTGLTYNTVFLGQVLRAVGGSHLVLGLRIAFNTVWLLALWSFIKARYSDPGVLPERWQAFVERAGPALPIAPARREWQPRKATMCSKCRFPRPERAHHCLICGCCVLRYDHHCPWINNCVGFYNHKFFLLVSVYTWFTGLIALASAVPVLPYCIHALVSREVYTDEEPDPWKTEEVGPDEAVAVFSIAGLGMFALVLLTPIIRSHVGLALQNLTSVEDFYENMPNPFDQGSLMGNLAQILGAPGLDWLVPVSPWRPLSDGVTFPCTPGEFCDGLLQLPAGTGRALLASSRSRGGGANSRGARKESETFLVEHGVEEDGGDDTSALLLAGGCHCPSQGDGEAEAMIEEDPESQEALWRLRYRLHERHLGQAMALDEESTHPASTPTLLRGLWSSFWRGRKSNRRSSVWL